MSHVPRHHSYTYAEYVAIENESGIKHEFLDGEIYVMAGGSDEHAALAMKIGAALSNAIGDQPCRAYNSDLRIRVETVRLTTYPDASVICGPVRRYKQGPETTALNPTIVVEVTSRSSERYDIGEKFEYYKTIPTLREYVIVSHRERRITVHTREGGDTWSTRVAITGGSVEIPSLNAHLSIDEIYRNSAISAD